MVCVVGIAPASKRPVFKDRLLFPGIVFGSLLIKYERRVKVRALWGGYWGVSFYI